MELHTGIALGVDLTLFIISVLCLAIFEMFYRIAKEQYLAITLDDEASDDEAFYDRTARVVLEYLLMSGIIFLTLATALCILFDFFFVLITEVLL